MNLFRAIAGGSILLSLTAFGCSSTPGVDNGKAISSVDLGPDDDTVSKGAAVQFSATAKYADGTSLDVTKSSDTVWDTSDPTVATVSETGMVTTVSAGVVDITADYKGVTGSDHFVVTP